MFVSLRIAVEQYVENMLKEINLFGLKTANYLLGVIFNRH